MRSRPVSPPPREIADKGSITPMVLGMAVCLLLLIAGITAVGSVFLAKQRLQNLCDGAALAASKAAIWNVAAPAYASPDSAAGLADDYLSSHGAGVRAVITVNRGSVTASCGQTVPVTFAWALNLGEQHLTVRSISGANYGTHAMAAPFGPMKTQLSTEAMGA